MIETNSPLAQSVRSVHINNQSLSNAHVASLVSLFRLQDLHCTTTALEELYTLLRERQLRSLHLRTPTYVRQPPLVDLSKLPPSLECLNVVGKFLLPLDSTKVLLPQLKFLEFHVTDVTKDFFAPLSRFVTLQHLAIHFLPFCSEFLDQISNLTNLTVCNNVSLNFEELFLSHLLYSV